MAKISSNFINSLAKDLEEIGLVIKCMLEQVKSQDLKSWKYPDKFSKGLDLKIELQELYNKDNDYEKYVEILEMLIDRLYFFLNLALSALEENCFKKNISRSPNISIGVLTNIFWKRIKRIAYPFLSNSSSSNLTLVSHLASEKNWTKCESCDIARTTVKKLIKSIPECLEKIEKKSALEEQRATISTEIFVLSQKDVMEKWTKALMEDIECITDHGVKMSVTNTSLETNLQNLQKIFENTQIQNKNLEEEIVKYRKLCNEINQEKSALNKKLDFLRHELASKTSEFQEMEKTHFDHISKLENDIENLEKRHEFDLTDAKNLCLLKINELENSHREKITELNEIMTTVKEKFEENLIEVREKFENEINELKIENENLEKIKNEFENQISKLEKSLGDKDNDMKRMETEILETKRESEEKLKIVREVSEVNFKKIVAENLELKEKLDNNLNICGNLRKDLETKLETITSDYKNLRNEYELAKKHEYTLLHFPDLNGPILLPKDDKKDPLKDMENQITANQLRIDLLREQTGNLIKTVQKIRKIKMKPKPIVN